MPFREMREEKKTKQKHYTTNCLLVRLLSSHGSSWAPTSRLNAKSVRICESLYRKSWSMANRWLILWIWIWVMCWTFAVWLQLHASQKAKGKKRGRKWDSGRRILISYTEAVKGHSEALNQMHHVPLLCVMWLECWSGALRSEKDISCSSLRLFCLKISLVVCPCGEILTFYHEWSFTDFSPSARHAPSVFEIQRNHRELPRQVRHLYLTNKGLIFLHRLDKPHCVRQTATWLWPRPAGHYLVLKLSVEDCRAAAMHVLPTHTYRHT